MEAQTVAPVKLPRVAITYCTQCRWMLRAAYFGQELLSTFGLQIGEIALIPATGGLFTIELTYKPSAAAANGEDQEIEIKKVLIWDRKAEGGFPETKVLKQRVRDHIDPARDLGHSDKGGKKKAVPSTETSTEKSETKEENALSARPAESTSGVDENVKRNPDGTICEDCR